MVEETPGYFIQLFSISGYGKTKIYISKTYTPFKYVSINLYHFPEDTYCTWLL